MKDIRIIVCGDRHYDDDDYLRDRLDEVHRNWNIIKIISGGASGADMFAEIWAEDHDVPSMVVRADWVQHGRAAGPIRNEKMLAMQPDLVVGFHQHIEESKGTKDMLSRAETAGIPMLLYEGTS